MALSKLAAGRDKNLRFVADMAKHAMFDSQALEDLVPAMNLPTELAELVRVRVGAAATARRKSGVAPKAPR